jgi:hypothetical protein
MGQGLIVLAFVLVLGFIAGILVERPPRINAAGGAAVQVSPVDPAEAERCKVPEFAKAMGHEEKWKLHNSCL